MAEFKKYVQLLEHATQEKQKTLFEGIRFGRKEMNKIEENQHDYNIGVEYEFHANDEQLFHSIHNGPQHDDNDDEILRSIQYDEAVFESIHSVEEFVEADNDSRVIKIVTPNVSAYKLPSGNFYVEDEEYSEGDFNTTIFEVSFTEENIDPEMGVKSLDLFVKVIKQYHVDKDKAYDDEDAAQLKLDTSEIGDPKLYRMYPVFEFLSDSIQDHINILDDVFNASVDFLSGLGLYDVQSDLDEAFNLLLSEVYEHQSMVASEAFLVFMGLDSDVQDDIIEAVDIAGTELQSISDIEIPQYSEYEFHGNVKYYVSEPITGIYELLDNEYSVAYSRVEEDSGMIEVITDVMPVNTALANMDRMFELISDHGYTDDSSGMHISISTNQWDLNDINYEKLLILLNFDHIHSIKFEERNYVDNFNDIVVHKLKNTMDWIVTALHNSSTMSEAYEKITNQIDISGLAKNKYQSLNALEYNANRGRIELRYFGGEDYEDRKQDITEELMRALTILDISYGNMYQKEFMKAKYVYLDNMFTRAYGVGISELRNAAIDVDESGIEVTESEYDYNRLLKLSTRKTLEKVYSHINPHFELDEFIQNVFL